MTDLLPISSIIHYIFIWKPSNYSNASHCVSLTSLIYFGSFFFVPSFPTDSSFLVNDLILKNFLLYIKRYLEQPLFLRLIAGINCSHCFVSGCLFPSVNTFFIHIQTSFFIKLESHTHQLILFQNDSLHHVYPVTIFQFDLISPLLTCSSFPSSVDQLSLLSSSSLFLLLFFLLLLFLSSCSFKLLSYRSFYLP